MTNKKLLYIKLITLIILFLLICFTSLQFIMRGGHNMDFSYHSGKLILSENFNNVEALKADLTSFSVEVVEHDSEEVLVEFYRTGFGKSTEPVMNILDNRLTIEEPITLLNINFSSGKILVYVPAGSQLPYDLSTASGSVKLNASSSTAVLRTISGSIKVYQGGDQLKAKTTSGSIKAYEPFHRIESGTTSGSIKLTASPDTTSIQSKSVSGSIKVELHDVEDYSINYSSVSGSFRNEYGNSSITSNNSSAALQINAKTTSGSIKLCDWIQ